jgi:hypothetical protein
MITVCSTARFALALAIAARLAAFANGQSPKIVLATVPFGIDVTKNLVPNNLSAVSGVTTNASRFNTALANRANNYAFFFPAGGYDFTETIAVPNRASYQVVGASTGRNGTESQYVSGWGANATRWLWKGSTGGTMLRVPGWGFHLDGVRFEANPNNNIAGVNRAGIGLHYVAGPNTAPTSASIRLGHLTFDGMDCAIFCGYDKAAAASPDSDGNYVGHTNVPDPDWPGPPDENPGLYSHADTSYIDRLDMRAIQQAGFWTANDQSVQHNIRHVEAVGFASASVPVLKIQRGGGVYVGYLQALNSCTFFEIDRVGNTPTITLEAWGADAQANNICLVRFNTGPVDNRISRAVVNIGPGRVQAAGTQYLIDTGSGGKNCTITLRGVRGLKNNSFKLNGFSAGGDTPVKHCCVVNLIGCELEDTDNPVALVDISVSTSLWRLNWKDCTARDKVISTQHYGNYPIVDNFAEADDMTP